MNEVGVKLNPFIHKELLEFFYKHKDCGIELKEVYDIIIWWVTNEMFLSPDDIIINLKNLNTNDIDVLINISYKIYDYFDLVRDVLPTNIIESYFLNDYIYLIGENDEN